MPELLLTKRAKQDLAALPRTVQRAVVETLELLGGDPQSLGKQLRGRLRGLWTCRVGNYRILYTIEGKRVMVRAIRHRAIAYRTRRRRRGRGSGTEP